MNIADNEISIITVIYNQSDFIKYQYLLLKKFMKNKFRYYCYNNADNDIVRENINRICIELGITSINIPQNIFDNNNNPSYRAGLSLDHAIKHNVDEYGSKYMIILDSDMFLIDYLDLNEIQGDFVGIKQYREGIEYYNNQLSYLNLTNLPNFENEVKFLPGIINGINTDCGGYLYNYFMNNKQIIHKEFVHIICSQSMSIVNILESNIPDTDTYNFFINEFDIFEDGKNFSELYDKKFLHFRAGSNWINFSNEIVKKRTENLYSFLDKKIE